MLAGGVLAGVGKPPDRRATSWSPDGNIMGASARALLFVCSAPSPLSVSCFSDTRQIPFRGKFFLTPSSGKKPARPQWGLAVADAEKIPRALVPAGEASPVRDSRALLIQNRSVCSGQGLGYGSLYLNKEPSPLLLAVAAAARSIRSAGPRTSSSRSIKIDRSRRNPIRIPSRCRWARDGSG